MNIQQFIIDHQQRVNQCLKERLAHRHIVSPILSEAMEYSLFAKGKRIRPILAYASAIAVGEINQASDTAACAVECIHTYSLIHDDLPAMDDDELRRGMPTCHVAFDEATAILAGDALLTLAFELLTSTQIIRAETALKLQKELAQASGSMGMVAGQALDLKATDTPVTLAELERIHAFKTGALIEASVVMGALSTELAEKGQIDALRRYSKALGLCFQIQDDILDVIGDTQALGKPQGSDQRLHKSTYVSELGIEQAQAKAQELLEQALAALSDFGEKADPLRGIARYIVERDR